MPTIGPAKATPTGSILKVTRQAAARGARSDVYDCLVGIAVDFHV